MDFVLGLSMTTAAARWVLVEGTTGEGAPVDRGVYDMSTAFDAEALLDTVLADPNVAPGRIHAIGVTWSSAAEDAASAVLEALAARGFDDVVAISDVEAVDALAGGIADITGYDDLAVCVVEPDVVVVAVVTAGRVTVERSDFHPAGADELARSVLAMAQVDELRPDAVLVLGSDVLDPIVESLEVTSAEAPIMSAAEADLALARGSALAAAAAVAAIDAQIAGGHRISKVGALTSVLAAAVVTLVVSLSVALGLSLMPNPAPMPVADTAEESAPVVRPSPAQAVPPSPRAVPVAPPRSQKTMTVAIPEVVADPPAAPVYVPPAPVYVPPAPAYVPPAPVYVPPAPPPAYVPPAPGYQPVAPPPPRLRDRIIERIPIINRFHEPKPQYGQ